jgi:hypothetical protein
LRQVIDFAGVRPFGEAQVKGPGSGLNEKALAQVKKWKMKPALNPEGKPVNCRVQIEITFHRNGYHPVLLFL